MSYSETIAYTSGGSLTLSGLTISSLTSFTLQMVGSPYSTTTPGTATTQHTNSISSLTSFSEDSTLASGTAISYQLVMNGIPYWYNATNSSWAVATNLNIAQSNTAAVINSNASTLFTSLNLITNQFLSLNIFMTTSNSSNTPILVNNVIGYNWVNSNATALNMVSVTGFLSDLAGSLPSFTSLTPVQLLVSATSGFFHGTNFIEPFTQAFNFSPSTGQLTCSIIETATPGVPLDFSVTYYDGLSIRSTRLFSAIVPNQSSVSLSNLSTAYNYDFG